MPDRNHDDNHHNHFDDQPTPPNAAKVWQYQWHELIQISGMHSRIVATIKACVAGSDAPVRDAFKAVEHAIYGQGAEAGDVAQKLLRNAIAEWSGDSATRRLMVAVGTHYDAVVARFKRLVAFFVECRPLVPHDHDDFLIVLRRVANAMYGEGAEEGVTVRQLVRDALSEAHRRYEDTDDGENSIAA